MPQMAVEMGIQPVRAKGSSNERIAANVVLSQDVGCQDLIAPNVPGGSTPIGSSLGMIN